MRPIGIAARILAIALSGIAAVMSVSMSPGVTALTVRPMPPASLPVLAKASAASRASDLVRPRRPDFDAA